MDGWMEGREGGDGRDGRDSEDRIKQENSKYRKKLKFKHTAGWHKKENSYKILAEGFFLHNNEKESEHVNMYSF